MESGLKISIISNDQRGENYHTFEICPLDLSVDLEDGSIIKVPSLDEASFIIMEDDWIRDPYDPEHEIANKSTYGIKVSINGEERIVPVWQLYTEYPDSKLKTCSLYWHAKRLLSLQDKTWIMHKKTLSNCFPDTNRPYYIFLLRQMTEKEQVAWMYKELEIMEAKEIKIAEERARNEVRAKYARIIEADTQVETECIDTQVHETERHRFTWGEGYQEYAVVSTIKTYRERTYFRGHLVSERTYKEEKKEYNT